jgi:hypothetical protein
MGTGLANRTLFPGSIQRTATPRNANLPIGVAQFVRRCGEIGVPGLQMYLNSVLRRDAAQLGLVASHMEWDDS